MMQTPLSFFRRHALAAVFLAAAASLAGAWFFELVLRLAPCPLCLQQRWPWYAALIIGGAGLVAQSSGSTRLARAALAVLTLLMLGSALLAIYHSGVEWGFWAGPAGCSAAQAMPQNAGNLLQTIGETRVPSCTEAAWRLLGLSLAGWNALISLGCFLIALVGLFAFRPPAHVRNSIA
jgi:disulfide bond formation protein DsbB